MEAFGAYIKNIAVFTLLMIFVEIIMPDGYSKKYTGFVLGIVLAVNAINPFMKLVNNGFDISRIMEQAEKSMISREKNISSKNMLYKSIFEENAALSAENDLKQAKINSGGIKVYSSADENGVWSIEKIEVSASQEDYYNIKNILGERYGSAQIILNEDTAEE